MNEAEKAWTYAFVFFILLFLGAAVAIIVIALMGTDNDLPKVIDVVLLDQNRGREVGMRKAINKYMPWVNKIYVLSPNKSGDHDEMTYVTFNGTQSAAFQAIPNIRFIAEHVIFFGDQTIPCRNIPKTYLFNGVRPRVFNVLESKAVTDFFAAHAEDIEPTMVADIDIIRKSQTTTGYIMRSALTEIVAVTNQFKRDVYFRGDWDDWDDVADTQLNQLRTFPPLFVTFHLRSGIPNESALNNKLKDFLNAIE